jgi:membrane protease YdiL (CAAX protease family)
MAILITAVLFAAIHLSWTNFGVLFVLGVALGYLYERTGNLWACMVLHGLFNGANLAGFFLSRG